MNDTESRNPLIEELADIEHQRWADWQKYLHGLCIVNADGSLTIPASNVAHWRRQIHTSYAELTEREKQSDRDQVERYMPIIDRIKQEAYARGQHDAYNDAAKDMKDMERDFRNEIAAAYREGAESGREW